jgi:antitoxin component of MazEF toxin-antitoxin module
MIRKLTREGNSLCLVIERPIRELMGVDLETPLKVLVEGRRLIIEPLLDDQRGRRFNKALAKVDRNYGKTMRKLAKR